MFELAEKLRAIHGQRAVTTFVKDLQSRYLSFCENFAALNDSSHSALSSRFRTVTDTKLIWKAATPAIIDSDQRAMEYGLTHDCGYIYRPVSQDWRKVMVIKEHTPEDYIAGVCLDITRDTRNSPLLSSAMDYGNECLWVDRGERTKLTRSDLVTLSFYLEGLSQRKIATHLSVTPKAIEKKVSKMHDLVPQLCGCGEHGTLHRCCFELGLTELLMRKRDWFDRDAFSYPISSGAVGKSLN